MGMTGATRTPAPAGAAFFDVDETLIAIQSMPRFLRHHFAASGRPSSAFADAVAELRALAARGVPRAEVSQAYYRHFAGSDVKEVAEQGRDWFASELVGDRLFLPGTLRAFREHADSGRPTVLVSGSLPPCLHPLAELLGATAVICAEPEEAEGRYTGGLVRAMIGPDKADAVLRFTRERGIRRADCHAYGDHGSDLPMLRAVGHPVVVGDDPTLRDAPDAAGWPRLPGVAAGRPDQRNSDPVDRAEDCGRIPPAGGPRTCQG
ncbi:HAD family hydrolase [Kitasatospora griseola]|uniref:HAD family hydrolase n=1 Tax=Kitasatospora griseola TaxID=2064 RepID=UPI00342F222A